MYSFSIYNGSKANPVDTIKAERLDYSHSDGACLAVFRGAGGDVEALVPLSSGMYVVITETTSQPTASNGKAKSWSGKFCNCKSPAPLTGKCSKCGKEQERIGF